MELALKQARLAADEGEIPVGAVLVGDQGILGLGRNRREANADPLAHAEVEAIRNATRDSEDWRQLEGSSMYVTLEPCAMCAGALVAARVETLVFGAHDPKAGYCGSLGDIARDRRLNHRLEVVSGVLAEESAALLKGFFRSLR